MLLLIMGMLLVIAGTALKYPVDDDERSTALKKQHRIRNLCQKVLLLSYNRRECVSVGQQNNPSKSEVVEIANVFVTDSQMRSSLAVIRSLGKKGLHVTGGETTRFATGFFSKYCERNVVYPSPEKEETEFVKFLINEMKNHDYDVLFPVADACLKPIINNYDTISEYTKIALPRPEIFLKGYR